MNTENMEIEKNTFSPFLSLFSSCYLIAVEQAFISYSDRNMLLFVQLFNLFIFLYSIIYLFCFILWQEIVRGTN